MALIECCECKKEISSKAKACPHCGLPIELEIEYHENGQMSLLAFLQDGKPDGLFISYNEDGSENTRQRFKNGEEAD